MTYVYHVSAAYYGGARVGRYCGLFSIAEKLHTSELWENLMKSIAGQLNCPDDGDLQIESLSYLGQTE